jgi:putative ABC transport system permease protein
MHFVVKSATPPAGQLRAIREALRRLEPGAGLEVATMYNSMGLALLPSQVGAVLMGSVGMVGLLLAAIGVYGVASYSVVQRTGEIGIRMALGAQRRDVLWLVLSKGLGLSLIGALLGLGGAWAVARLLAAAVPALPTRDPITFLGVTLALMCAALLACYIPARRATRVNPMVALRYE